MLSSMTPMRAFMELVEIAQWPLPGVFRSGGAISYVRDGKPIPDYLLPGRLVQRTSPEVRSALGALTSDRVRDAAPWAVKQALMISGTGLCRNF